MSDSFSSHERKIARILSVNPAIKNVIKKIYQYISWLQHKKKYNQRSLLSLECFESTHADESFFGYYDKSPINKNGEYIVYHSSKLHTHSKPNRDITIEVILQKLSNVDVLLRIPSHSYNWQQGCRVQWLDNDLFIFNDFDESLKRYIARVWSVSTLKEVKIFDLPVQDSYQTKYFLSLNYQRIMALRPDYGYRNMKPIGKIDLANKDNDGIWKIDYVSGDSNLLLSFSAMCKINSSSQLDAAIHKVNHIMVSPSGSRFIFLHRYYIGQRKFDRLLVANSQTGELKLLADYEMVSHCAWVNDNIILGYLRGPDKKDGYWFIDVETGNFSHAVDGKLDYYGDGHPHVHGDWFVTDTYPDKARMQHLILVNWKTGSIQELGEFFHGFKYSGETRCDLHPRFTPDGKYILFDSVFSGLRKLYKVGLNL